MIVFTADPHLDQLPVPYNTNVRTKWQDFEVLCQQLKPYATDENTLIIGGDLYDNSRPTPAAVVFFRRMYDEYLKGFKYIILLDGNHDNNDLRNTALDTVEAWKQPNIKVVTKIGGIIVDGWKIFCIPHQGRNQLKLTSDESYEAALSAELTKHKALMAKCDFIIGHGTVTGAQTGTEQFLMKSSISIPVFDKLTLLGHIHKPQLIKPQTYYVGSPGYTDFSEIDDIKRFLTITRTKTGITVKSIPITALQQYRFIDIDCTKSSTYKLPAIEPNCIYKVVVRTTKELRPHINAVKLRTQLNEKGFVQHLSLDITGRSADESKKFDQVNLTTFTPKAAFESWLNKNVTDKPVNKRLLKLGVPFLEAT